MIISCDMFNRFTMHMMLPKTKEPVYLWNMSSGIDYTHLEIHNEVVIVMFTQNMYDRLCIDFSNEVVHIK